MTYSLLPFPLINFSALNSFLKLFFVKDSNNFYTIKILYEICPRHCIFNFFNSKSLFRPIWNVTFRKNVFIFLYSLIITKFKFRIFIIISIIKVKRCFWFCIKRFHFNSSMICIVLFFNYVTQFINIEIFWY